MAKSQIDVYIKGHDQASAALKGVGGNLDRLSGQFRKAGLAMTAFGAAAVAAMGMMIKKYAEAGDEIGKMSIRTGIATESLSKLKYMADLSDTSLETVAKAVRTMQGAIVDASEGMATYIRAFDRIGLSVENLMGLSPEQQFWTIAEAIAAIEDPTIRAATAGDIFGTKLGTELIPMFDGGAEGIREMADEADRMATIFSQKDTKACAEFNDAITALQSSSAKLVASFAKEVMPTITEFVTKITEVIGKIGEWLSEHETLKQALIVFGGVLTGFTVVGGPILLFLSVMGKLVTFIKVTLIPWVKKAIMAFIAWAASMGPAGWAAIAGGIAAATAGIIAMNKLLGGPEVAMPSEKAKAAIAELYPEYTFEEFQAKLKAGEIDLSQAADRLRASGKGLDESGEILTDAGTDLDKAGGTLTEAGETQKEAADSLFKGVEELAAFLKTATGLAAYKEWLRSEEETFSEYLRKEGIEPSKYQHGGIVTRPTLGLLGEAGPEAVIPLGAAAGNTYNITVQSTAFMGNEWQARELAEEIYRYILQAQRAGW